MPCRCYPILLDVIWLVVTICVLIVANDICDRLQDVMGCLSDHTLKMNSINTKIILYGSKKTILLAKTGLDLLQVSGIGAGQTPESGDES